MSSPLEADFVFESPFLLIELKWCESKISEKISVEGGDGNVCDILLEITIEEAATKIFGDNSKAVARRSITRRAHSIELRRNIVNQIKGSF